MTSHPSPGDIRQVEVHPSTPAREVTITMAGEIDRDNSAQAQSMIEEVLERQQPHRLCLDLQDLTFVDSSGIRSLLTGREQASRQGCELVISRVHPHVRQVLAITSLLDVFCVPDVVRARTTAL